MKVSIILTSYNHEKFLKKSIDSVLAQTYKDFQLIIVDDFSEDASWDIIQGYTDERIIAVRNPKNMRTEGIYNAVHKYVKGEYLAIHHSDDEWLPDKLEKQVTFMEQNSNIAACFTQVQVIDEDEHIYDEKEGFYYDLFRQKNRSRYEWLNYFFYHGNCLCHPSVLIRSRLFFEEEMFDFGYAQIPDFARWVRICLKHDIYILPERLTRFRVLRDNKNTSGNRADTIIRSSVELYHLLKLYSEIPTAEEFVKVFPEGKKYADGKEYIPQYAFARICTRPEMDSYTRLYGIDLLYDLMNDRKSAKIIEKQYLFTFRDLINMTGKKDIFHVLEEKSNQQANIYLDFGEGFTEQTKIQQFFYLNEYYEFQWMINLPPEFRLKRVNKLRFDPVEGIFSLCKLEYVKIDNKIIQIHPLNALDKLDEYEVFETLDPVYISDDLDLIAHKISICGEVRRLSYEKQMEYNLYRNDKNEFLVDEINKRNQWIAQLQTEKTDVENRLEKKETILDELTEKNEKLSREKAELSKKNEGLFEKNEELNRRKEELNRRNEELNRRKEQLENELEKIKNHKLYRIWNKVKGVEKNK